MNVTNMRKIGKASLVAAFSVELRSGIHLHDVMLHSSSGSYWVSFPSKPVLEAGRHVTDQATGRGKYSAPLVSFASREVADGFKDGIVSALRRQHSDLFTDTPGAPAVDDRPAKRPEEKSANRPISEADFKAGLPF